MSSKFEYSVSYPSSVPALWSLISTEQYWRELVQATNAGHGALESFAIDGDTVTVVTTQGVGAENLPSVVTAVRPGDLEIPRTSVFRLVGETIAGSMKADVKGAPATIEGDITISGDPAVASYLGTPMSAFLSSEERSRRRSSSRWDTSSTPSATRLSNFCRGKSAVRLFHMARRLSYSARYTHPAETIYQALSQKNYWDDLMEGFRELTPISKVHEFDRNDDGIRVELQQTITETCSRRSRRP